MQETLYFYLFCKYSIIKTQVNCNFDTFKILLYLIKTLVQ